LAEVALSESSESFLTAESDEFFDVYSDELFDCRNGPHDPGWLLTGCSGQVLNHLTVTVKGFAAAIYLRCL